MSNTVALSSTVLSSGTYSLDHIEKALESKPQHVGVTLDVMSGDILLCGRRLCWTKRAKAERRAGDLALLNTIKDSIDAMENKHAKILFNQAMYEVLHKKTPLTVRKVQSLVQDLRSMQVEQSRGKDVLALRTAKLILDEGGNGLYEASRQECAVALRSSEHFSCTVRDTINNLARMLLAVVEELYRQKSPEALFRRLHNAGGALEQVFYSFRVMRPPIPVEQRPQPAAIMNFGLRILEKALHQGGMEVPFPDRVLASYSFPGMEGFVRDLHALSRPRYCRDVHPDMQVSTSRMLDALQGVWHLFARLCQEEHPPLFPVLIHGDGGSYEPKLRQLASDVFELPPEFRRIEAPDLLKEKVIGHITPKEPFIAVSSESDPYQIDKSFLTDIRRDFLHLSLYAPAVGHNGDRVELDISPWQDTLLDETVSNRNFGESLLRVLCGANRQAIYAVSSVLHQGACNGVLMGLYDPGMQDLVGFPLLPVAFSASGRRTHKKVVVERTEQGDYFVHTLWRNAINTVGILDASRSWTEPLRCREGRSVFGIDIKIRLHRQDIEAGQCAPVMEHLFLEMGYVPLPEEH